MLSDNSSGCIGGRYPLALGSKGTGTSDERGVLRLREPPRKAGGTSGPLGSHLRERQGAGAYMEPWSAVTIIAAPYQTPSMTVSYRSRGPHMNRRCGIILVGDGSLRVRWTADGNGPVSVVLSLMWAWQLTVREVHAVSTLIGGR